MIFHQLQDFRQTLYDTLGNARDALFDLMDAVLVSGCIPSFVSLSQSPVFRREWSSIYAALHDSQPPRTKIMKLWVKQIATEQQPILVGDVSKWHRPAAKKDLEGSDLERQWGQWHSHRTQVQHLSLDTGSARELGTTGAA